ncbi:DNA-binding response regulator, NarL/FixJ family, contains REC and HTH domains [Sinosporangium album]|uniref:DNA-binding response regulator, NarL/FixJ family, contains REC and HTH domains n=1 Tax=Sinosporangium album TaxID=504805 RepID=A0A1G8A8G8_9ACTN|nr:response regulator transcription factor [Sinosporangium album]SDH17244.1 DNA-binding response regulator, NarL/FixJ family, contains REC and HTH domains [Sinosporangium album]
MTPEPTDHAVDPEPPVRVLVVDDQRLIREAIASLLGIQPGIAVVGTAGDGRDAVEQAVSLAPDVVLMDVRMPEMDGVAALAALRDRAPGVRVVMLTTFDDEEYVVQALRAGATGYLLKDLPARELAAAVRLAHAGVAQFDPAATARLASAIADRPGARPGTGTSTPPGTSLTSREVDVLRLIARGSTNREIAGRLHLSEGTVKNHISRILTRLGLRDRTQAAVYARDHDLL